MKQRNPDPMTAKPDFSPPGQAAAEVVTAASWVPKETVAEAVLAERNQLRAALARLVGTDGREELEALEATMRLIPAPTEDKAASLDAIHALLATLPEG